MTNEQSTMKLLAHFVIYCPYRRVSQCFRFVYPAYGRKLNMQRETRSTNLTLIKIANYTYMVAAVVYAMYSLITQTGLCGYLMDAQLRWFGVAYETLTALIALMS